MLGRILRRGAPSSSSSTSSAPFNSRPANPFPVNPPRPHGRKLDITFNERYMQGPRQLPVMSSIWRMKQKSNIRKSEYKKLPAEEKQKLYLESRPMKQRLLDWVGTRSRALVRAAGTVDAWAGPAVRGPSYARIGGNEVKLLTSGGVGTMRIGMSERAKRILAIGMVMSMGGLMAWLFVEKSKLEGLEPTSELDPKNKRVIPLIQEELERRPGVFVWGSNR